MPKFKHKGGTDMLKDEVMEKVITHKEIRLMCVYEQSKVLDAFCDVFKQLREEIPYATISDLFDEQ